MSSDADGTDAEDNTGKARDGGECERVDPCGCATRPPATGDPDGSAPVASGAEPAAEASPPPAEATEAPGRTVKLVAVLRAIGTGYRAQLAAGAEDCDPELRLLEVPDLQSALAALPDVLAAAEARWQARPRYPSAPLQPANGRPRASSPPRAATTASNRVVESPARSTPPAPEAATVSAPPIADQLSLFG
jgi:hypothetical protein